MMSLARKHRIDVAHAFSCYLSPLASGCFAGRPGGAGLFGPRRRPGRSAGRCGPSTGARCCPWSST